MSGERGPSPKAVPTYPELTCHSLDDLRILDSRPKTHYDVDDECLQIYENEIIPYWRGLSMRDRLFAEMTDEWKARLRGRHVHRVHGTARARPHGPG